MRLATACPPQDLLLVLCADGGVAEMDPPASKAARETRSTSPQHTPELRASRHPGLEERRKAPDSRQRQPHYAEDLPGLMPPVL